MGISDYLKKECCIMDLRATTKDGAIKEMAECLSQQGLVKDTGKFIQAIMGREKLGSTGIGKKVAIPHAPTDAVDKFVICFARSKEGLDFEALDGEKVYLLFMMGTNPQELTLYLKLLSELSRLLRNETFRNELLVTAQDGNGAVEIIRQFERH